MKSIWWVYLFALVIVVSFCYMHHAYYPFDKSSREKVRQFIMVKGISYGVLATATIIEMILGSSNLIVPCLTIYIAIMEAVQNIIQSKAERFNEDVKEKLEKCKQNKSFEKETEKLFVYCSTQIERLKYNTSSDLEQLVFEKVHDYLKYYTTANNFFLLFNKYRMKQCTYEDLQKALDDWKTQFECYGEEIVKYTELE